MISGGSTVIDMSSIGTAGLARGGLARTEDPITRVVEAIVRKILEEEKVLVHISGKVKEYRQSSIAISKSDPALKEVKVEKHKKADEAKGFMEELSKLR